MIKIFVFGCDYKGNPEGEPYENFKSKMRNDGFGPGRYTISNAVIEEWRNKKSLSKVVTVLNYRDDAVYLEGYGEIISGVH